MPKGKINVCRLSHGDVFLVYFTKKRIKLCMNDALTGAIIMNKSLNNFFIKNSAQLCWSVVSVLVLLFSLTSCRDKEVTEVSSSSTTNTISQPAHNSQNNLDDSESSFLASQKTSLVHWQPWGGDVFKQAKQANKTVLALVGKGTDPNMLRVLDLINKSSSTCASMNQGHINTIIDTALYPDMGLFTSLFCTSTSQMRIATPMLIWFSYEGHPISWTPINAHNPENIILELTNKNQTVQQIWQTDSAYVLSDSKEKYIKRMKFFYPEISKKDTTLEPYELAEANLALLRRVTSLYDPSSYTADGTGKISLARYISLMLTASRHPTASKLLRNKSLNAALSLADNVLLRGMIDPLDGGVFDSKQLRTYALPTFAKSLHAQAESIEALAHLYQTTKNPAYLKAAKGIIEFIDLHLKQDNGLYGYGIVHTFKQANDNPCLWTIEELSSLLSKEEMRVYQLAFGIVDLGNIPLTDDPHRAYFHKNTLARKLSNQEVSNKLSISIQKVDALLNSASKKLAKARLEKSAPVMVENIATVDSNSLLVRALTSLYQATGDQSYLQRATSLIDRISKNNTPNSGILRRYSISGKAGKNKAQAIDLALLCQAMLEIYSVTLDANLLTKAQAVHSSITKNHYRDKGNHIRLLENTGSNYPTQYPANKVITDKRNNSYSTWAITTDNAHRLHLFTGNKELLDQSRALTENLNYYVKNKKVLNLDFLALQARALLPTLYIKGSVNADMRKLTIQSGLRIITINDLTRIPFSEKQASSLFADLPDNIVILYGLKGSSSGVLATSSTVTELKSALEKYAQYGTDS